MGDDRMRPDTLYDKSGHTGISGLFSLIADGLYCDGVPAEIEGLRREGDTLSLRAGSVLARAAWEETAEGVLVRDDSLSNEGENTVRIRRCLSRFALQGNEYDVYTQYSGWMNESEGAWQPLNTGVTAFSGGLRTNENASPVLALWDRQTGHGIAFHLFASCSWIMRAAVRAEMQESVTVIECGVNDAGLDYPLAPGETLRLPRILVIPFTDKRSIGCDRLHAWFDRVYPKTCLPVICNTWMMTFDRLDTDALKLQADRAAELGAEYFVVDAGWFGKGGRWVENIGLWEEDTEHGFRGRLREFADHVRARGMGFGLWLEVERANPGVPSVQQHPEWYIDNGHCRLLDFGNEEALSFITDTVLSLIDRYGIAFIKSDFNDSVSFDPSGCGFLKWHRGHERFLRAVRAHAPGIYIENCASGGHRLELYSASLFDSCWISDTHSPYHETRILRDTLKRLPPSRIEMWPVLNAADGFIGYDVVGTETKIIACHDATWGNVQGLEESWLRTYVRGCVLGFSFDLMRVPDRVLALMGEVIKAHKADRAFFLHASARLLIDTDQVTAIRYGAGEEVRVCVFAWRHARRELTLYPEESRGFTFEGRMYAPGEAVTIPCPPALQAAEICLRLL